MKIQRIQKTVFFLVLGFVLFTGKPASADLGFSINLNFGIPPTMLYLDGAGVYVAVGTHYDLFFIDGIYFHFHDGHWYSAVGYNGPWNRAGVKGLPPGLRKNKLKTLQGFRDNEYKAFKSQGSAYKGKTVDN